MDHRPANPLSRSAASSHQRRTSIFRLLPAIAVSLALLGLALAIPLSMSADAAPPKAHVLPERLGPAAASYIAGAGLQTSEHRSPSPNRWGRSPDQWGSLARAPLAVVGEQSGDQPEQLSLLGALAPLAGPSNGGFESGDLSNWVPDGSAASAEVLESFNWATSNPDGPPTPIEGNFYALLCSGPGEQAAGSPQGNIDSDPTLADDFDTSIIRQTFVLEERDVPAILSFDWAFMTAESNGSFHPNVGDDFFQVTLNGVLILAGSAPGSQFASPGDIVSPYADVPVDGLTIVVNSTGDTNTCNFVSGRSDFAKATHIITATGTYVLEFLVADQVDAGGDTGLLIDNIQLTPEIDLEIDKTARPDPAIAGEPLIYEVTVTNHGIGRAKDVVVTDTLPLEVDFITDTLPIFPNDPTLPQGCTFSPGTGPGGRDQLVCFIGDMIALSSRSFEIEVDVKSNALAGGALALVNMAELDSLTPDRDLRNNVIVLETILQDEADLRVLKMSKPDTTVRAGETFTYSIFVDNLGPSHTRNVVLTDTILSSGDFVLLSVLDDPNRPADACALTLGTFDETLIACSLGESLEPQGDPPGNGRWVIKVAVMANDGQDVNNVVDVFSLDPDGATGPQTATPDPDLENNQARAFISVTAVADLDIEKIGRDPLDLDFSVVAGRTVSWTITISNAGPSLAENVTLVDILPRGLVDGSLAAYAEPPRGAGTPCTLGTPGDPNEPLICQLGNMAPLELVTVTILADVDPAFVANQPNTEFADYLANDALLTSDTFDPDARDNIVFDVRVGVTAEADLVISKIDRPDPVIAGELLEYSLVITNSGPSVAEDVVISDTLPAELTAVDVYVVNEPTAKCEIAARPATRIDCGLGDIDVYKTMTIVITSLVDPATLPDGKVITNKVETLGPTYDPITATNVASETTTIHTEADVEITKFSEPVKVFAGEQKRYTITVTNQGPSDAQDVVVYDVLPDEVDYEIDNNSPNCTMPFNLAGFRAVLTGEEAGVTTIASGWTTFVLITDTVTGIHELLYAVEVSDIVSVTLAHIHEGAAGATGPVAVTLYGGPPRRLTPPEPFVGRVNLDAINPTLWSDLLANPASFYVNVHTELNPAGEVRGQMALTENSPLRCEIGTMTPNALRVFDIWAFVQRDAPANSIIRNVAIVTTTTTDPIVYNNVAHSKNYVQQKADLKLTKFGKMDEQVRAGDILTYTVIVDNLGPSWAGVDGRDPITGNVALKDILQSSDVFDLIDITSDRDIVCEGIPGPPRQVITATTWPPPTAPPPFDVLPPTGVDDIDGQLQLDCTMVDSLEVLRADGPPNSGRWILTMRVRAEETQDLNNVAHVVADVFDPNPYNNQAEVMHEITDVSDLEISKSEVGEVEIDGQPAITFTLVENEVTAGLNLTYTVVITNLGPSTAENVVLLDRLPPWIVVTGYVTSQGDCDTGTPGEPLDKLTCGLDTLRKNEIVTVTINAHVPSWVPEGTILENDVFAFSDNFDDHNGNSYTSNLTTVSTWADLAITKSARGDNINGWDTRTRQYTKVQLDNEVTAGELLEYRLVITNYGPSDAQKVVISDTLPPPAGPVAMVHFLDADGASCRQDPVDRNWVFCELGPNASPRNTLGMVVNEVRTVYILVLVDPSVAPGTTITNVARVSSDTRDPWDGEPPPGSGDNNTAINETIVSNAVADIWITKVDVPAEPRLDERFEPDKAIAGDEHRYLITFGNNGPSLADNVVITDALDLKQAGILGETLVRCEPLDPDDLVLCSEIAFGVVNVDLLQVRREVIIPGSLNPGDTFSFWLITEVDPGYVLDADDTGTHPDPAVVAENTAFIRSDTTDYRGGECPTGPGCLVPANNQDTEQTEMIGEADLEVGKTDTPDVGLPDAYLTYDPVSKHFIFTYTLTVRNRGPSDAATVLLTDTLPVDAEFIAWTIPTEDMDCVFRDDGTVFCLMGKDPNNLGQNEPGRMNVGTEISFTITARVDADSLPRILVNRVEVSTVSPEYADVYFPTIPTIIGDFIPTIPHYLPDRRPTPDRIPINDAYAETTIVFHREVRIDKVAVVGRDLVAEGLTPAEIDEVCRTEGVDDFLTLPPAQITYCYFVNNEGDSWLTNVKITDTHSINIVEVVAGPFVNVIGRVGTNSEFILDHALWASIEDNENSEVAPLSPRGIVHPDGYTYLLAMRSVILDFADGGTEKLGDNTAMVIADPCTKYSTLLPGVPQVIDTDLLHDTLAVPVLETTTKSWRIFDDDDGDERPSPGDIIEYSVFITNTGIIEATGVDFYDGLYNYINDNPLDPFVPALLVNGSVTATIHVAGIDPFSGREIDFDVEPPDLPFGHDLLLISPAPGVTLTYASRIITRSEFLLGNQEGDDEVQVATRVPIPPKGELVRFNGETYDPPIQVTFSLRVRYHVRIKDNQVCCNQIMLNHGWVDYNEILLFDQRFPEFNPWDVNQFLASNRVFNIHAGTPGHEYEHCEFPGWPEIPLGVEPTNFVGTRFEDADGVPTAPNRPAPDAEMRDDDDPTWFLLRCESPRCGADWRLVMPGLGTAAGPLRSTSGTQLDCEAWIQVQNVGDDYTQAALVLWGNPGPCAPQAMGPLKVECSGLLRPGSAWTWLNADLPSGAQSGIIYSLYSGFVDDLQYYFAEAVCEALIETAVGDDDDWARFDIAYREQEAVTLAGRIFDFNLYYGEPLAVTVNRTCPGDNTPSVDVSAAYAAFSTDQQGIADPVAGGYAYYAPLVWATHGAPPDDMTTILHLQNVGTKCTSVDIWFQEQDNCLRYTVGDITRLAPGEAYPFDPNTVVGPNWQGSAWIGSSQPLGVLVDIIGRDMFGAYRGVPADSYVGYGDIDNPIPYSIGSLVNYAPLIYREYSGWDTGIQVQNLSSTANAKVSVIFMDSGGNVIGTIADWICPRGSQTFLLPAIANLPGYYVGSARVESQSWWAPGDDGVDAPYIQSVVNTVKYQDLTRAMPLELMAYNALQEPCSYQWQLGRPRLGMGAVGVPFLARGNRGVTSELALQNLNPNSGSTEVAIFIYDQNRLIDFICEGLSERQVEYIDLDMWPIIPRGFLGSAVVQAQRSTQLGGAALAGVAVERVGRTLSDPDIPGDESKAFEAFPLCSQFQEEVAVFCPGTP